MATVSLYIVLVFVTVTSKVTKLSCSTLGALKNIAVLPDVLVSVKVT